MEERDNQVNNIQYMPTLFSLHPPTLFVSFSVDLHTVIHTKMWNQIFELLEIDGNLLLFHPVFFLL